ncbi:MAG: MerR family transcriptional regulator [Cyanobacteria bacterium P01_A01_bin.17]
MTTELSIQEVAKLTQLSAHTLRYYERIGLLDPVRRASSGHRRYSKQDIGWIEFITRLRATGMPIRDMQRFAELRRQGDSTFAQRRELLEAHQQHIVQQLEALEQNSKILDKKIRHYKQLEAERNADTR